MASSIYDDLQETLAGEGPPAAIDRLCLYLREHKEYSKLFYALLMKKRHELGVSPIPTGPVDALPAAAHEPYEDAIREAARLVGRLFLEERDIANAWAYFRMIGEPDAVATALESFRPGEDEDIQAIIEIAFHQGVNPKRGFDLILERYGLCSAITTLGGQEAALAPENRTHCVKRLVRALYDELRCRLAAEIARRDEIAAPEAGVRELMRGRDWLFADEFGHVDVSHLAAVVQMSIHLPAGEELELARELCAYGERLSSRLRYPGEPPFDDQYRDYGVYLAALAGDDVEAGIAHFRGKAEAMDPENDGTRPAEVLVNLLLRLDRKREALEVARRYLARADARFSICPSLSELCQRSGAFGVLAEAAREQDDPVHFLAGLIAQGSC